VGESVRPPRLSRNVRLKIKYRSNDNKMHNDSKKVIGIAWYRKEQWILLRQTIENPNDIENTYEEWLDKAMELKRTIEASGLTTEEVDIDIPGVITWCKKNNKPINSNSISEYAAYKLKEKDMH
jgi:hypothetical protein